VMTWAFYHGHEHAVRDCTALDKERITTCYITFW
jgi:hypothetical protein